MEGAVIERHLRGAEELHVPARAARVHGALAVVGRDARVDQAVAIDVHGGIEGLARVEEPIPIAVEARVGRDLTGVDQAVAIAVELGVLSDLVIIEDSVTVTVDRVRLQDRWVDAG